MIFAIFLIVLYSISINAKDVCRLPKNWKTYVLNPIFLKIYFHLFSFSQYDFDYNKRQNEWATTNSKTDYYKLVLSWSPTYCKQIPAAQRSRHFQCQQDDFGLIV
jgi:ribonuclease I